MAGNLWEQRYTTGDIPWDSGVPSLELQKLFHEHTLQPKTAIELGCGTGSNAVWLAQQGIQVVALDVSETALQRARERAAEAGVEVDFRRADLLQPQALELAAADLVFDRGVYHVLRRENLAAYLQVLQLVTRPGSLYIVLAGSTNDLDDAPGPPKVHAHELCAELHPLFQLIALREFVWHGVNLPQRKTNPLGWSAILRRM
jgi:cyclopropane fatty-acyl-phospholipid synthase-like methyltransferase